MGDFSFKYVDDAEDGEPVVHNEAAVFTHAGGKVFLYRGKDGDWIIGNWGICCKYIWDANAKVIWEGQLT